QPDRQRQGELLVEQRARGAGELGLVGDRLRQRAGPGNDPELGVLHLERYRAAAQLAFGDLRPDAVDDVVERLAQRGAARQVLAESALAAVRLADAFGANGPEVDPAGGPVEIVGEAAEVLPQERDVLRREVRPRFDA